MKSDCALCTQEGGDIVFQSPKWRVVMVDDASYPGFCRVIWTEHVSEMTDLFHGDRTEFMQIVWHVEAALRDVMRPHKINIASLGNMVPHLHWHVIPRFMDDAHFPESIWASTKRVTGPEVLEARRDLLPQLRLAITRLLQNRLF